MSGALARVDPRRALAHPLAYRLTQWVIRGARSYREIANRYLRVARNDRILDIGCGPATLLAYLPPVHYVGFDESPSYIDMATRRFGSRGTFLCRTVDEAAVEDLGPASFDLVVAYGLVHHLDDRQAERFFALTSSALKPRGRLVTLDGCYAEGQSRFARFLISKDRGRFVRDRDAYVALARTSFPEVRAELRHDLLRLPYTLLVLECGR